MIKERGAGAQKKCDPGHSLSIRNDLFSIQPAQRFPAYAQVFGDEFFWQALHQVGVLVGKSFIPLLRRARQQESYSLLQGYVGVGEFYPVKMFHLVKLRCQSFPRFEAGKHHFPGFYAFDKNGGIFLLEERFVIRHPPVLSGKLYDEFFSLLIGKKDFVQA